MFQNVLIIGPGLLGASLARCLFHKHPGLPVTIWGRDPRKIEAIRKEPWGKLATTDLHSALQKTDFAVLATPVPYFISILNEAIESCQPNTVFTDVGSTKEAFMKAVSRIAKNPVWREKSLAFVGAHPMAGSEAQGWEASDPDLFSGRVCHLVPLDGTAEAVTLRVRAFWESIGMRVLENTTPEEHDKIVSKVSHLPHLLAGALAAMLGDDDLPLAEAAGPGLRDFLRIAGSNPVLWRSIVEENAAAVRESLESYQATLSHLKTILEEKRWKDLEDLLSRGRSFQKSLRVSQTENPL